MAGLSKSEYQASLQREKPKRIRWIAKITLATLALVFLPQLLLFAMPFWIVTAWLLGAIKAGIDLPDFR